MRRHERHKGSFMFSNHCDPRCHPSFLIPSFQCAVDHERCSHGRVDDKTTAFAAIRRQDPATVSNAGGISRKCNSDCGESGGEDGGWGTVCRVLSSTDLDCYGNRPDCV